MAPWYRAARNGTLTACVLLCGWLGASAACAQAPVPTLVYATQIYGRGNANSLPAAGDVNLGKNTMTVDPAGNVYVTGMTFNGANTDFLTIKYSAAGSILWRATANGAANGDDIAYAIAVDANGNVLVTGSSQSDGQADYLTVKYDSNGNEVWRAMLDGAGNRDDEAYSIAVDAGGNVFVTGASFGPNNNYDYVTVKYSPTGAELWRTSMDAGNNSLDRALAMCVDAGGNAVVTGYSFAGGAFAYVTVKYDAAGLQLWRKALIGAANIAVAFAMACDPGGNVVVTGKHLNGNDYDYMTVKYDAAGNELWRAPMDGPGHASDSAFAVVVDSAGNVIVTGQSQQPGLVGASNPVHLTVKYSASGVEQWRASLSGSGTGSDTNSALAVDGAGIVYATGFAMHNGASELVVVCYGPAGGEQWRAFISGTGPSSGAVLQAINVDAVGNVVVAGYRSNGTDNDFLVVKFDSSGHELWRATEGENDRLTAAFAAGTASPNVISGNALAIDPAGNVYVAGQSGLGANSDFIAAKIDANGIEQWRAVLGGFAGGLDRAYAIAVDGAGSVVVAGDSSTDGYSDFLAVRYDSLGRELWRAQPGHVPKTFNSVRALALDPQGNIVVTGASSAGADFLTIKYNALGQEMWKRTVNGAANGSDVPVAMAIDATGNIYVTGRSYDGAYDGYLTVKYDPSGAELWRATLNGSADAPTQPFAIRLDATGSVVVAGDAIVKYDAANGAALWRTSSGIFRAYAVATGPDRAVIVGGSGGLIVKYDANGYFQWQRTIHGNIDGNDVVYSVAVDDDGAVYATSRNGLDANADYLTVKFNAAGSERWRITTPTAGGGAGASPALALDSNRNLILAGNAVAGTQPPAILVAKYSQAPLAPANVVAQPGNGLAMLSFDPPVFLEAPVSRYTVTCQPGGATASGPASPLIVALANEVTHACVATAANVFGTSVPSAPATVTPSASVPIALLGVQSRKTHGSKGEFGLDLDLTPGLGGAITVEPRAIGAGHKLVFTFNTWISYPGNAAAKDASMQQVGSAVARLADGRVEVTLSAIADNTRLLVSLTGVNGGSDVISVPVGFLVGDVTNSRSVNAADISAIKAHRGNAVNAGNFRFDLDASGTISAADVSAAKARSGAVMPPP